MNFFKRKRVIENNIINFKHRFLYRELNIKSNSLFHYWVASQKSKLVYHWLLYPWLIGTLEVDLCEIAKLSSVQQCERFWHLDLALNTLGAGRDNNWLSIDSNDRTQVRPGEDQWTSEHHLWTTESILVRHHNRLETKLILNRAD